MPKLNPEQAAGKWQNRLSGSVEDVKQGIMRVTDSPMAKAAAQEDKWFLNLQKAKQSGRYKRGLLSVSLEEWKEKAANVGADRIPTGAAAASGKMATFYGKLFPHEQKLQSEVAKMPNTTLEDSIARMTTWVRGMAQFDKTK